MDEQREAVADIQVENHGTLFLFFPMTPEANDWMDQHVEADATWAGNALVVEHRYAWDLVEGMKADGLRVI